MASKASEYAENAVEVYKQAPLHGIFGAVTSLTIFDGLLRQIGVALIVSMLSTLGSMGVKWLVSKATKKPPTSG